MTASTIDDFKVKSAALVGLGTPAMNLFLEHSEAWLKVGVLIGQIAVAGITFLYILTKWLKIRKAKNVPKNDDV